MASNERGSDSQDLFGKLESLIQKHQGRALPSAESAPTLTDPVEASPAPAMTIPVLHDAVVPDPASEQDSIAELLANKRRQLQVALYLRLRQRLDHELNEALAENLERGTSLADPAFSRVAQGLRAMLPVVVRDAVEQVFGLDLLDTLRDPAAPKGDRS